MAGGIRGGPRPWAAGPVGIGRIGRIRRLDMALPVLFVARQLCAHDCRGEPQGLRHSPWEQEHTGSIQIALTTCAVSLRVREVGIHVLLVGQDKDSEQGKILKVLKVKYSCRIRHTNNLDAIFAWLPSDTAFLISVQSYLNHTEPTRCRKVVSRRQTKLVCFWFD